MYTLELVRELAFKFAQGLPGLYKRNDAPGCLTNVPFNWYLADQEIFKKYLLKALIEQKQNSKIHIINDCYIDPHLAGGYYELPNGNLKEKYSNLQIEGDNYIIVINPHQEEHDKRFTLVKELCSLYTNYYGLITGEPNLQLSHDYEDSLKSSHKQKTKINANDLAPDQLESDTFAIFLATELMIPPRYRKHTSELLDRIEKEGMSMNDIAQSLCMPEYMLKKVIDLKYYFDSCQYYTSRMAPSVTIQPQKESLPE